jgi:cytochrome c peroxidase
MSKAATHFWPNAILAAGVAIFVIALLVSEDRDRSKQPARTATTGVPAYVPQMPVPADNPMSAYKVALGRKLFYETALSINESIACASCHQQDRAFTDGLAFSPGATGELTRRNAMSLANVGYNGAFTWADNTVVSLEQQALLPLTLEHPVEMGIAGHEATVLARLQDNPDYRNEFAEAFPESSPAVTLTNVVKALASFQRTLLSYGSPYDRYLAGDRYALSVAARRGRELFFSAQLNCFRCHGGHNFRFTMGTRRGEGDTSVAFHNTGLYNTDLKGSYPASDQGLLEITGLPEDMGKFKSPTLRNVALTAPYMHDGSMATLEEVLRHYARGGRLIEQGPHAGDGRNNPYKSELVRGFSLSADDTAAMIAFLTSLTDENFVANPAFSNPANASVKMPD